MSAVIRHMILACVIFLPPQLNSQEPEKHSAIRQKVAWELTKIGQDLSKLEYLLDELGIINSQQTRIATLVDRYIENRTSVLNSIREVGRKRYNAEDANEITKLASELKHLQDDINAIAEDFLTELDEILIPRQFEDAFKLIQQRAILKNNSAMGFEFPWLFFSSLKSEKIMTSKELSQLEKTAKAEKKRYDEASRRLKLAAMEKVLSELDEELSNLVRKELGISKE